MNEMNRGAATPPTIITAEDIIAKMRAGIREVHEISFRELKIPVRVLSIDEINRIRHMAKQSVMLTKDGDQTDANVAMQKITLQMASQMPQQAPLLGEKVLSLMTVDEVNYLYNEYIRIMDSVNPSLETMSETRFREMVEALKKKEISSNDLSIPQLKAICSSFVDLILKLEHQRSHKDNSHGGQPVV